MRKVIAALVAQGLVLVLGGAHAQSYGTGTGFFVSSDGHLVTSAHVVDGAHAIAVRVESGERLRAELVAVDKVNDLALLKVAHRAVPVAVGSTSSLPKGTKVYTLGFPSPQQLGFKESKYAEGVVSSLFGGEDDPTTLQVSTPLQPGNSGGPILTNEGVAVGVVKSRPDQLATLKSQGYFLENVSFAVKADYLRPLLEGNGVSIPHARETRSVAQVERSIVLVVAFSESANRAGSTPVTAPAPPGAKEGATEAQITGELQGSIGQAARGRGFQGFQFSTLGPKELEYEVVEDSGAWKRVRTKSGQHLDVYRGIAIVFSRSSEVGKFSAELIDALPATMSSVVERTFKRGASEWQNRLSFVREEELNTPLGVRRVRLIEHLEKGMNGNAFHEVTRTWVDTEFDIPWKREVQRLGGRPSERMPFQVILVKAP